jgi:hypothetical protein
MSDLFTDHSEPPDVEKYRRERIRRGLPCPWVTAIIDVFIVFAVMALISWGLTELFFFLVNRYGT